MSSPKVIGGAGVSAAATLPVTGSSTTYIVLAGIAMVIMGFLLVRSGRYVADAAPATVDY